MILCLNYDCKLFLSSLILPLLLSFLSFIYSCEETAHANIVIWKYRWWRQTIESSFHVDAGSCRAKLEVIFFLQKVEAGVPDYFWQRESRWEEKHIIFNNRLNQRDVQTMFAFRLRLGTVQNSEGAQLIQNQGLFTNTWSLEFPELMKFTEAWFSDPWLGSPLFESVWDLLQYTYMTI